VIDGSNGDKGEEETKEGRERRSEREGTWVLGKKEREGYQSPPNKNPAYGSAGPHSFYRTGPPLLLIRSC
jgi:hypothetical protein